MSEQIEIDAEETSQQGKTFKNEMGSLNGVKAIVSVLMRKRHDDNNLITTIEQQQQLCGTTTTTLQNRVLFIQKFLHQQ